MYGRPLGVAGERLKRQTDEQREYSGTNTRTGTQTVAVSIAHITRNVVHIIRNVAHITRNVVTSQGRSDAPFITRVTLSLVRRVVGNEVE